MPIEDLPDVPTLEEMYQLHRRHRVVGDSEDQRQAWFIGADAVNGKLLILLRDKGEQESVASFVSRVLEAWDTELLDRAVARTLARQARPEEPAS